MVRIAVEYDQIASLVEQPLNTASEPNMPQRMASTRWRCSADIATRASPRAGYSATWSKQNVRYMTRRRKSAN